MIMVVIRIFVVLVHDVLAIEVVGQAVSSLWFLVFGISHFGLLLGGSHPYPSSGLVNPGTPSVPFWELASSTRGLRSDRRSLDRSRQSTNPFNRIAPKRGGSGRAVSSRTSVLARDYSLSPIPYKPRPIPVKLVAHPGQRCGRCRQLPGAARQARGAPCHHCGTCAIAWPASLNSGCTPGSVRRA